MDIVQSLQENPVLLFTFIAFAVFILACKGYALWLSARRRQAGWFIALLLLQTFAILDIIYIFFIAKNKIDENSAGTAAPMAGRTPGQPPEQAA